MLEIPFLSNYRNNPSPVMMISNIPLEIKEFSVPDLDKDWKSIPPY